MAPRKKATLRSMKRGDAGKVASPPILIFCVLSLLATTTSLFGESTRFRMPGGYWIIQSKYARGGPKGYWDQGGRKSRYMKEDKLKLWDREDPVYPDRLYRFIDCGEGWYFIQAKNGGFVDVKHGTDADDVPMQLYDGNGTKAQKFLIKVQKDGYFKIFTYWGRTIITKPSSDQRGNRLVTWSEHGTDSELWTLVDPSNYRRYPLITDQGD